MLKGINKILKYPSFIAGIMIVIVIIITAQSILLKPKILEAGALEFTHYNNYLIFKYSYYHLIHNQDLYKLYPEEHWDLFKYSPAFSLLMAPLAYLPDFFGLLSWNLLNALVLLLAIWKLPQQSSRSRLLMLGFLLIELIGTTQNNQSNALIAGLIILAFICLEKQWPAMAALLIVCTVFIKLFGLVAVALFIFYPGKLRAACYLLGWTLLLAALPLTVVSPSQLSFLYQSWMGLLQNDHSNSFGLSVAGVVHSWFGLEAKTPILLTGATLLLLPLTRFKNFHFLAFRIFFLSSILIWVIIFNHKAESATFIIAVAGIAIWFFTQKIKIENVVLVIIAFIFTILSPTEFFPKSVRNNYVVPYALKAVPCILIWCKIFFDLVFFKWRSVEEI